MGEKREERPAWERGERVAMGKKETTREEKEEREMWSREERQGERKEKREICLEKRRIETRKEKKKSNKKFMAFVSVPFQIWNGIVHQC